MCYFTIKHCLIMAIRLREKKGVRGGNKLNFNAIDIETAIAKYISLCSLSKLLVRENKIVDEKNYSIKPPGKFMNHSNKSIHRLVSERRNHHYKYN